MGWVRVRGPACNDRYVTDTFMRCSLLSVHLSMHGCFMYDIHYYVAYIYSNISLEGGHCCPLSQKKQTQAAYIFPPRPLNHCLLAPLFL